MVSKLIIVSKNTLPAFSLPPLILKLKKIIDEKAKIQTPLWTVWNVILLNSNLLMSEEEFSYIFLIL